MNTEVTDVAFNVKVNVIAATYQPNQPLQPFWACPTGNCTWDPFVTLGFCPVCTDVSSTLEKTCSKTPQAIQNPSPSLIFDCNKYLVLSNQSCEVQTCTVKWPGPIAESPGSPTVNFNLTYGFNSSIAQFAINEYMVVSCLDPHYELSDDDDQTYLTAYFPPCNSIRADIDSRLVESGASVYTENTTFTGTRCIIKPCLLSLNASVSNGVYQEQVIDKYLYPNDTVPYGNPTVVMTPPPKWGPERGVFQQGQTFGISATAIRPFEYSPYNGALLNGEVVNQGNQSQTIITFVGPDPSASGMVSQSGAMQSLFLANFTNSNCSTPNDTFTCFIEAFANALTKSVRDAPYLDHGTASPLLAKGNVLVNATFVSVRWQWLSLPVLVWLLSIVTWLGALWKTRSTKVPFWTDSVLPLLYLYRDDAVNGHDISEEDLGDFSTSNFRQKAKGTKVTLVSQDNRMKLSGLDNAVR